MPEYRPPEHDRRLRIAVPARLLLREESVDLAVDRLGARARAHPIGAINAAPVGARQGAREKLCDAFGGGARAGPGQEPYRYVDPGVPGERRRIRELSVELRAELRHAPGDRRPSWVERPCQASAPEQCST